MEDFLTVTVIAPLACLEDTGVAEFCHGTLQVRRVLDRPKRCRLEARIPEKGLFPNPVLGRIEQVGALGNVNLVSDVFEGVEVNVFKFVGQDVRPAG